MRCRCDEGVKVSSGPGGTHHSDIHLPHARVDGGPKIALSIRNLMVLVAVLAGAWWWLLRDDPEARVRNAHEELIRLVNTAEEGMTLLNVRALQALFAPTIVVFGDADTLADTYTPEQLVATILGVTGRFDSIDLTISRPAIEKSSIAADDEAVSRFSAMLTASSAIEGLAEVAETRRVVSRMRKIDGDWRFAEFSLMKPSDD